jgi:hypothetical protein
MRSFGDKRMTTLCEISRRVRPNSPKHHITYFYLKYNNKKRDEDAFLLCERLTDGEPVERDAEQDVH